MGELPHAQPVLVGDLLLEERRRLLEFLVELQPEDWERPTECPAWTLQGICLHLLGDDLSLLSRQRDERPSPVALAADAKGWDQLFVLLDQFNEAWVDAASFLSTALLFQLLQLTGEWTHAWYASVDPERLGEPIAWVGPEPAPYWLLAAREYLERWIHHQQIRRALNTAPLDETRWVVPAVATAARGFPAGFSGLRAGVETTISLMVPDAGWTTRKGPEGWELYDGVPENPTVRLEIDVPDAALMFSRGLHAEQLRERITVVGDEVLGSTVVAGLSGFFGRR